MVPKNRLRANHILIDQVATKAIRKEIGDPPPPPPPAAAAPTEFDEKLEREGWCALFDTDKIKRLGGKGSTFHRQIKTDGEACSVLFSKIVIMQSHDGEEKQNKKRKKTTAGAGGGGLPIFTTTVYISSLHIITTTVRTSLLPTIHFHYHSSHIITTHLHYHRSHIITTHYTSSLPQFSRQRTSSQPITHLYYHSSNIIFSSLTVSLLYLIKIGKWSLPNESSIGSHWQEVAIDGETRDRADCPADQKHHHKLLYQEDSRQSRQSGRYHRISSSSPALPGDLPRDDLEVVASIACSSPRVTEQVLKQLDARRAG
ncbi:hypothetical protein Pmani_030613 [Petrolisthes manimaculis]|uniref:Uncharacterized protein n=1 Tax=Petrolisthes manimaculis TaxID=1843537 RepID=A0AAE1NV90_9EUCA|nr:hypothetical protein Pmani_030613 [Petrolisthes manimaculis]